MNAGITFKKRLGQKSTATDETSEWTRIDEALVVYRIFPQWTVLGLTSFLFYINESQFSVI